MVCFADGYWMAPVRVFAMQRRQGWSYNMGEGDERNYACFFNPEGWEFEKAGVRICNNGLSRVIRARFGCFIADIKALAQICSIKGQSGNKPCPCCKNTLGHCEQFVHDYYCTLHYSRCTSVRPSYPRDFRRFRPRGKNRGCGTKQDCVEES